MIPFSLYGTSPKKMRYARFGHLSERDRSLKIKELRNDVYQMITSIVYRIQRYECEYGLDWTPRSILWSFANTIVYHIGICSISSLSIDDMFEIATLGEAPYMILSQL